jgi:hypothetical protein
MISALTLHRSVPLEGELSSVKVSRDSRYALVNHPQDVSLITEPLSSYTYDIYFILGNILV